MQDVSEGAQAMQGKLEQDGTTTQYQPDYHKLLKEETLEALEREVGKKIDCVVFITPEGDWGFGTSPKEVTVTHFPNDTEGFNRIMRNGPVDIVKQMRLSMLVMNQGGAMLRKMCATPPGGGGEICVTVSPQK